MSETVEVPFVTIGNRQVLTAMQVAESPWLGDFIRSFPKCFAPDHCLDCWVYYPEGDAPTSVMTEQP